ncbi:PREDICTED: mitochondrial calcium uniporter regulator 1 isoform X2 [Crocodylus porosus]|uniref:mitochondrial calcium uniporter regulator 1 isoform X2 n=1 Tax=Crocodylus porosus TaxID=8502 RepID=UPI00093DF347|nr:PREDICTED: mitochondrial calcium uniporter regulator 1 isoform X2 [Crocodylus porosus]
MARGAVARRALLPPCLRRLLQLGPRGRAEGGRAAPRDLDGGRPAPRRCPGDWKRLDFLALPPLLRLRPRPARAGSSSWHQGWARGLSISASSSLQTDSGKGNFSLSGSKKLFFDTHALVRLLEENGFTTLQSEIIVSALVKITDTNLELIYKDMVTKVQQEIVLQQIMSHIGGVKKDMVILEKSEFSALRAENEKIKLELQQLKKQVMDEVTKLRTDNKLDLNLEKSRVKELYSLNERKLLEMRSEIVELHAQQDRALTQTDRKIDTEVAGLKTMLESHKLDNIKYLAGTAA